MAVKVKFIADPFKPSQAIERDCGHGLPALDAVRATFPEYVDAPIIILRRNRRLMGDELLERGDQIIVGVVPQASITTAMVVKWIVQALVAAAVSYLVSALTKPKARSNNAKAASPSYSIQLDQNAARLGEIIPVIYGRVRAMPDIASQPYSEFISHNENAHMILCLGMGEFEIYDVYVGESKVSEYPPGNITYQVFGPGQHGMTLGNIEAATGICEDMVTIAEAGGIDMLAPNDPSEASIAAVVSGGTLTPVDNTAVNVWGGLVPGRMYNVSNSAGGSTAAVFVGIGANNSSVWDRPLPQPPGVSRTPRVAQLTTVEDAAEGTMALYYSTQEFNTNITGELIYIEDGANLRGPFEVARWEIRGMRMYLRLSGPGWTANMGPGNGIWPAVSLNIVRNAFVQWNISEYIPGVDPNDPYRWLGWYMTGRSDTLTNRLFVDVVLPNGIAWIADKGNFVNHTVGYLIDIQQVDTNGNPIGGVTRYSQHIVGATSTARKITWQFNVATARYRIRVARFSERNQSASKEISATQLFSIRYRVYHPAGTRAYEQCTLIAMSFKAGSGLSAATTRRVTVDCGRLVLKMEGDGYAMFKNPANIVVDAYTNPIYGGGRPRDEIDIQKYWQLSLQWDATAGFNAIYDSQITLIEAMQQMLNVVRAIPTPVGRMMSVTQDCPRAAKFLFDDAVTIKDSLTIGYSFDGEDVPDCLEVTYTDPVTFAEARAYYPSQGVRPETMELFGCTNYQQAMDWAKCVWQDRLYNRKTAQLELEAEGYLLGPLDRYGVSIDVLNVGASGRVTQWFPDSNHVELDAEVPAGSNRIRFVGDDGRMGPALTFVQTGPRELVIQGATPAIYTSDNRRDATVYHVGVLGSEYFDFSAVNIQTSGALRVEVSGKQYTDAAYAGTFIEHWTPGD